eukprot:gene56873-biopygen606
MRAALRRQLANLRCYRPFIPRAVLLAGEGGPAGQGCLASPAAGEAPRGRVALMFTDIVQSTKLWEANADAMEECLELHNTVIRHELNEQGGYEESWPDLRSQFSRGPPRLVGDAFMASFADPVAAVRCAMDVQIGLTRTQWPVVEEFVDVSERWRLTSDKAGRLLWHGITVRIGVGYGEVADELNPVTGRIDYKCYAVVNSEGGAGGRLDGTTFVPLQFLTVPEQELKGIGKTRTHAAVPPELLGRVEYVAQFHSGGAACPQSKREPTPGSHEVGPRVVPAKREENVERVSHVPSRHNVPSSHVGPAGPTSYVLFKDRSCNKCSLLHDKIRAAKRRADLGTNGREAERLDPVSLVHPRSPRSSASGPRLGVLTASPRSPRNSIPQNVTMSLLGRSAADETIPVGRHAPRDPTPPSSTTSRGVSVGHFWGILND